MKKHLYIILTAIVGLFMKTLKLKCSILLILLLMSVFICKAAGSYATIPAGQMEDKVRGAWAGKMIGVMVTTTDAGSEVFIHPPYKIKVGERLAFWALAKTYGTTGIPFSGPIYNSYKQDGKTVEIAFDYGEDGMTPENENLKGFEIAGADGKLLPARAEIIGGSNVVKVWNDSVAAPKEVRYCFRNYIEGNLCNNTGIPASPFRIVLK